MGMVKFGCGENNYCGGCGASNDDFGACTCSSDAQRIKVATDMDDDATLTYMALVGYANWIETGDFCLSALDASNAKKPFKALASNQMRRVLRLRDLAAVALVRTGEPR
jgi:hypothetical protein